jgi:hypothetical protein
MPGLARRFQARSSIIQQRGESLGVDVIDPPVEIQALSAQHLGSKLEEFL